MCVLTFFPDAINGFIITNNRDENEDRPKAVFPQKYTIEGCSVYYPKDVKAGGTWIATNVKYTLCLLNGAFEKHVPTGKYLKSRGQVILDFFKKPDVEILKSQGYFQGIENFTLILIESNKQKITEIVWDGLETFTKDLNWQTPYIWSSCTLYSSDIIKQRQDLYERFLYLNPAPSPEQLFDFNKYTEDENTSNNLVIRRSDGIKTQSICQIINKDSSCKINYIDLQNNKQKSLVII